MPAPAVIPAPGVSMMIAAVKEFVVEAGFQALQAIHQRWFRAGRLQDKERLGARLLSDEG